MKRLFKRLLLSIIGLYGLWLIAVFLFQRHFFFPAYLAAEKGGFEKKPVWVEQWEFPIAEGLVYAWYAPGASEGPFFHSIKQDASPTVIFAHGNGEVLEQQVPLLKKYRRAGINSLVVEYRGYGFSNGSPSEENIVRDFESAYERLRLQPEVLESQIFFHGRSMGTGVMCAMTKLHHPAGLILESPFLSLSGFYPQLGVPSFIARDRFESKYNIQTYAGPGVVFHGRNDDLIPFYHGQGMAAALRTAVIAFDAKHNDIPRNEDYWGPVFEMIKAARDLND